MTQLPYHDSKACVKKQILRSAHECTCPECSRLHAQRRRSVCTSAKDCVCTSRSELWTQKQHRVGPCLFKKVRDLLPPVRRFEGSQKSSIFRINALLQESSTMTAVIPTVLILSLPRSSVRVLLWWLLGFCCICLLSHQLFLLMFDHCALLTHLRFQLLQPLRKFFHPDSSDDPKHPRRLRYHARNGTFSWEDYKHWMSNWIQRD